MSGLKVSASFEDYLKIIKIMEMCGRQLAQMIMIWNALVVSEPDKRYLFPQAKIRGSINPAGLDSAVVLLQSPQFFEL